MSLWWSRFTSKFALFYSRHKRRLRHAYWTTAVTLFVFLFGYIFLLARQNYDVDIFVPSGEARARFVAVMNPYMREMGRLGDFATMYWHMEENFPFFGVLERVGVDIDEVGYDAFEHLREVARDGIGDFFFLEFVNEYFISELGGFGGIRLSGEGSGVPNWLAQPYFFGYYDWRFSDERFTVDALEYNFTTQSLADGIAYLRVNSFLPKGYEHITRNPFWFYDFETERARLLEFYQSLDGYDDLIIDIRGISNGFSEYFIPLIMEPNLDSSVSERFYGFHTGGEFAHSVSEAFRNWYGIAELQPATAFPQIVGGGNVDDFELLDYGFAIDLVASGSGALFPGQIWLLADSGSFTGANHMYLKLALQAGFNIIYEENPYAPGWDTSLLRLPHSRIALRFNPLYFTDSTGRAFEEFGAEPTYRLESGGTADWQEQVVSLVSWGVWETLP